MFLWFEEVLGGFIGFAKIWNGFKLFSNGFTKFFVDFRWGSWGGDSVGVRWILLSKERWFCGYGGICG